jgi:hypothetical protein
MQVKEFFESDSNVSMIKRSVFPKGVITKLHSETKLVRTLASHLKTQKVVTMQDLRLPEFDVNRCINQQKVLVFDNNNVKYNIFWVQTCYPRLDSSQTAQKETWNDLISPSHFVHLEVWIQKNSMPWKTCLTSKSRTSSLVKINSNALQQGFWMPSMKRQL